MIKKKKIKNKMIPKKKIKNKSVYKNAVNSTEEINKVLETKKSNFGYTKAQQLGKKK